MADTNLNKGMRRDIQQQVLIGAASLNAQSPWFILDQQHTIIASGLTRGVEVHFEVAVIKGGSLGELCQCLVAPPKPAEIEYTYPLLCPECMETDEPVYVRLTHNNMYAILDAPAFAAIRAVLVDAVTNEPIEDEAIIQNVRVVAHVGTHTDFRGGEYAGCPPECEYIPTFSFPCEGYGFSPSDDPIDPKATVGIEDCDGNVLVYIYPKPYSHASTPIEDCEGNILGYAVNGTHNDCGDDGGCGGSIRNSDRVLVETVVVDELRYAVWSDGTTSLLILKR